MEKKNNQWVSLEQAQTIEVNGVKMLLKDYLKDKKKTQSKKVVEKNEIQLLPSEIDYLMKNIKVLKSLSVYFTRGKRTWGNEVVKNVLERKEVNKHFSEFRLRSAELHEILNDIKKFSKKSETSVYQYVDKFVWKLEEIKQAMENLYKGVKKLHVIEDFKDKEWINGTQKRLGLKILMQRTAKAIDEIDIICIKLTDIADNKVNSLSYKTEISKWGQIV